LLYSTLSPYCISRGSAAFPVSGPRGTSNTSLLHAAQTSSDSQEILRILSKLEVHHRVHKSPTPVPIPSQISSVHALTWFLKIHFNILPHQHRLLSGLCPTGFSIKTLCAFLFSTIHANEKHQRNLIVFIQICFHSCVGWGHYTRRKADNVKAIHRCSFRGRLAKFRKATISSVVSVRPDGTIRLPMDGCSRNFVFDDFSKICCENSGFIKI